MGANRGHAYKSLYQLFISAGSRNLHLPPHPYALTCALCVGSPSIRGVHRVWGYTGVEGCRVVCLLLLLLQALNVWRGVVGCLLQGRPPPVPSSPSPTQSPTALPAPGTRRRCRRLEFLWGTTIPFYQLSQSSLSKTGDVPYTFWVQILKYGCLCYYRILIASLFCIITG